MYLERIVFDTGIYVSRMLSSASVAAQAVRRASRSGVILISPAILLELSTVLHRPKFHRYVTAPEVEALIEELRAEADLVHPTTAIKVCRDPDDDHVLSLALDGRADVVVTGDQDLAVLHPFRGIPILSPRAFLDRHPGA